MTNIVRILLQNDCDPNSKDIDCWSPVHLAAKEGHTEVLELLRYIVPLRRDTQILSNYSSGEALASILFLRPQQAQPFQVQHLYILPLFAAA
jgi:ankyrin repeat protein